MSGVTRILIYPKLYLSSSPTALLYLTTITIICIICSTSQNGNGTEADEEYDKCLRLNAKNLCDSLFERANSQNLLLKSNSSSNVPLGEIPPSPTDLSQNTSQQTWESFTDPENEFSMEYPSSWVLKPAENRFDSVDVNVINNEGVRGGIVQVLYNIMGEKITSMMKEYGYNNKDLDGFLESTFPSFISTYTKLPSFNQIEEAQYDKYEIGGHKAGSFVASFEVNDIPAAGWFVGSLIGNKFFVFQYSADQNQFDANMPIAEHMLNSIKILDKK